MLRVWIEAMRLRTLPVSLAGVLSGIAMSVRTGNLYLLPAALCLLFALLAQIASNFANEYFDYKAGLDRAGRDGPRRGVTEGDISPGAMLNATLLTLGLACFIGLTLIYWGGWWLIPVGLFIAVGVLAYSTGPYPLSHHGLGEVAVIFFFGIIPVNFTYWLASGHYPAATVVMLSFAVGLLGANVLVVNNLRDRPDDSAVGKKTLAVRWGERAMVGLYTFNALVSCILFWPVLSWLTLLCLCGQIVLCCCISRRRGRALNPMLGLTAVWLLLSVLMLFIPIG